MNRRSKSKNRKQREKNKKSLSLFSTVEVGQTCLLIFCCREVRLGATPCKVGAKLTGFNTLSDQYEEWEVVTVHEPDHWQSIVRRTR